MTRRSFSKELRIKENVDHVPIESAILVKVDAKSEIGTGGAAVSQRRWNINVERLHMIFVPQTDEETTTDDARHHHR